MKRLLLLLAVICCSIDLKADIPYRNNQPAESITFVELRKAAPIAISTQTVNISQEALCDFDGDLTINDAVTVTSGHALSVTNSSNVSVSNGFVGVISSSTISNFPTDPNLSTTENSTSVSNRTVIHSKNVIINGSLTIQGHLVINGDVTVTGNAGSYINIASGGTLEVRGTLSLDGAHNYNVENAGTISATDAISIFANKGATGVSNSGTLQSASSISFDKNTGTAGYAINNTGTVTATNIFACSNFGTTGNISGISNITNIKGSLVIDDVLTVSASNDISKLTAGTSTVHNNATVCVSAHGSITNFTDTRNLTLTENISGDEVVIDADRVTINGKLVIGGKLVITGDLVVNGNVADYLNITSSGTLEVQGSIFLNGDSQYNVINAGSIISHNGNILLLDNHSTTDYAVKNTGSMTATEIIACGNTGVPKGIGGGGTFNGTMNVTNVKGTLTITDSLTIDGNNNIAGMNGTTSLSTGGHACINASGTITGITDPTPNNLSKNQNISSNRVVIDAETLILNGKLTINGGYLIINGNLEVHGTVADYIEILSGTLDVRGTVLCNGSNTYNVINNGTFIATDDITFDKNKGGNGVYSTGTIQTSGNLNITNNQGTVAYGFNNDTGTVTVAGNILACGNFGLLGPLNGITPTNTKGDLVFTGVVTVDNNHISDNNQAISLTNSACVNASGTITFMMNPVGLEEVPDTNTGFVVIEALTTTINSKLIVRNNSHLIISGDLTVNGNVNDYVEVESGSTLSVYGELLCNGSHIYNFTNSGTITVTQNATFANNVGSDGVKNNAGATIHSDLDIIFADNVGNAGYGVNNEGTITASGNIVGCANSGTSGDYNNVTIDNPKGSVTLGGALTITTANNVSGTITTSITGGVACLNASGTIDSNVDDDNGNLSLNANTGSGKVIIDASSVTLNGKLVLETGAYLVIKGDFSINGNAIDYIDIASGATLEVHGDFNFNGSSQYNAVNAGTITVGTSSIVGDIGFNDNFSSSTYAFDNQGTMSATGEVNACGNLGAGTVGTNATADISGLNNITGSHGTNITNVKGTLTITDELTITTGHNISGVMSSGSATLSASGHACLNVSGMITDVPTVTNFDQNANTGTDKIVFDADTLIINGKFDVQAGTVVVNGNLQVNGTTGNYFVVAAGATLEVRGDIICDGASTYNAIVDGTLDVKGKITLQNNKNIVGAALFCDGTITSTGDILIQGNDGFTHGLENNATIQTTGNSSSISLKNNTGTTNHGVANLTGGIIEAPAFIVIEGNQGAQNGLLNQATIQATNLSSYIVISQNTSSTIAAVLNSGTMQADSLLSFVQNSGATHGVETSGTLTVGDAVTPEEIKFIDNQGGTGWGVTGTGGTISFTPEVIACGNFGDSGSVNNIAVSNPKGDLSFNEDITVSGNSIVGQGQAITLTNYACITSSTTIGGIASTANLEQVENTSSGRVVIDALTTTINGKLTIQNNSELVIVGNLTVNGNDNNYLSIESGSTLTIYGNLILNGNHQYEITNAGTIIGKTNATLLANRGSTAVTNTGTITITNDLIFNDNVGTSSYAVDNGSGTITASQILACANIGSPTAFNNVTPTNTKGAVIITDTLTVDGSNNISGTVSGTTNVVSDAACLNASGTITNINDDGGELSLNANTNSGKVVIEASDFRIEGKLILQNGAHLLVKGNCTIVGTTGTYIDIASGAQLEVDGNLVFNGDSQFNMINNGTITATGDIDMNDNHSAVTYAITNNGTISAGNEINACGNTGEGFENPPNDTADISGLQNMSGVHGIYLTNPKGTLTINDNITVTNGDISGVMSSGTASLSASGHACLNASGTITNIPTATNFDQIQNTGSGRIVIDAQSLILQGLLHVNSGHLIVNGDLTINGTVDSYLIVASGAILEVRGNLILDGQTNYTAYIEGNLTVRGSIEVKNHERFVNEATGVITSRGAISFNNNSNSVSVAVHNLGTITSEDSIMFDGNNSSGNYAIINEKNITTTGTNKDITITNITNGGIENKSSASIVATGNIVISNNQGEILNQGLIQTTSASKSITVENNTNSSGVSVFNNEGSFSATNQIAFNNNTGSTQTVYNLNGTMQTSETGGSIIFNSNSGGSVGLFNLGTSVISSDNITWNKNEGSLSAVHLAGTVTSSGTLCFVDNIGGTGYGVDGSGVTITGSPTTIKACANIGETGSIVLSAAITNIKGTLTFNESITVDSNNIAGQNQPITLTDFACINASGSISSIDNSNANLEQTASTGTGHVVLDADTIIINQQLRIQNSSTLIITNDLVVNGSIDDYVQIDSSSKLIVYGTVTYNGNHNHNFINSGSIEAFEDIIFTANVGSDGVKNNTNATIYAHRDILFNDNVGTAGYAINDDNVPTKITADGSIQGCANTGTLGDYNNVLVANSKGEATLTGTLTITSTNDANGTLSASVIGGEICLNASGTIDANISDASGLLAKNPETNSGKVIVDAGKLTIEGKLILQAGAYLLIKGDLVVNGNMNDYLDIASGATLEVHGNFNFNGASQYNAVNAGTIIVGTSTIVGNIGFDDNFSSSTYAFDNQGTMSATGEVNACGNLGAGTVLVNATADISGLDNISGSHGIEIANPKGTLTLTGTVTVDGSNNIYGNGSTPTLSSGGHACINASGSINNIGTLTDLDQNANTGSGQVVIDANKLVINGILNLNTGSKLIVNGDLEINAVGPFSGGYYDFIDFRSGSSLEVRGNIILDGANGYYISHSGTITSTNDITMKNSVRRISGAGLFVGSSAVIEAQNNILIENNSAINGAPWGFATGGRVETLSPSGSITIQGNQGETGFFASSSSVISSHDILIQNNVGTDTIGVTALGSLESTNSVIYKNNSGVTDAITTSGNITFTPSGSLDFVDNAGGTGYGVNKTGGSFNNATTKLCGNYGNAGTFTGITPINPKGTIEFTEDIVVSANAITGENQMISLTDHACITASGIITNIATTTNLEQIENTDTGRVVIDAVSTTLNGKLVVHGNSTLVFTGDLIVNGNVDNYLEVKNGSELRVYGQMIVNGDNNYSVTHEGNLNVIGGDLTYLSNKGTNGVTNTGTITLTGDLVATGNNGTAGYAILNSGTITAASLVNCGNVGTSGEFSPANLGLTPAEKGDVTISDSLIVNGDNISGMSGSVTVEATKFGCLTASGTITNIDNDGGNFSQLSNTGNGQVIIEASKLILTGTLNLQNNAYLVIKGDFDLNGNASNYLNIDNTSTLEIQGNANFNGGSTYNVINAGTITAAGNIITFDDNHIVTGYAINNSGTITAAEINGCGNTGSLGDVGGGGTLNGTTDFTNVKGTLTITDTLTVSASPTAHTISGTGSGTASISVGDHACINATGNITNVPTVANLEQNANTGSGRVVIDADEFVLNGKLIITDNSTVIVNGNLTINSTGGVSYIDIRSGSTLDVRGNIIFNGSGASNVANNGTILSTGTFEAYQNVSTLGNAFSNTGAITVNNNISISNNSSNSSQGVYNEGTIQSTGGQIEFATNEGFNGVYSNGTINASADVIIIGNTGNAGYGFTNDGGTVSGTILACGNLGSIAPTNGITVPAKGNLEAEQIFISGNNVQAYDGNMPLGNSSVSVASGDGCITTPGTVNGFTSNPDLKINQGIGTENRVIVDFTNTTLTTLHVDTNGYAEFRGNLTIDAAGTNISKAVNITSGSTLYVDGDLTILGTSTYGVINDGTINVTGNLLVQECYATGGTEASPGIAVSNSGSISAVNITFLDCTAGGQDTTAARALVNSGSITASGTMDFNNCSTTPLPAGPGSSVTNNGIDNTGSIVANDNLTFVNNQGDPNWSPAFGVNNTGTIQSTAANVKFDNSRAFNSGVYNTNIIAATSGYITFEDNFGAGNAAVWNAGGSVNALGINACGNVGNPTGIVGITIPNDITLTGTVAISTGNNITLSGSYIKNGEGSLDAEGSIVNIVAVDCFDLTVNSGFSRVRFVFDKVTINGVLEVQTGTSLVIDGDLVVNATAGSNCLNIASGAELLVGGDLIVDGMNLGRFANSGTMNIIGNMSVNQCVQYNQLTAFKNEGTINAVNILIENCNGTFAVSNRNSSIDYPSPGHAVIDASGEITIRNNPTFLHNLEQFGVLRSSGLLTVENHNSGSTIVINNGGEITSTNNDILFKDNIPGPGGDGYDQNSNSKLQANGGSGTIYFCNTPAYSGVLTGVSGTVVVGCPP